MQPNSADLQSVSIIESYPAPTNKQKSTPKMKKITFLLIGIFMSCSTNKIGFSQFDFSQLEKNGYSISLDSKPIDLTNTYLNNENILSVNQNKSAKTIEIIRKDKDINFISLNDLLIQKKYNNKIDHFVINNSQIDSSEISKIKFENGSLKYIRLLTQKDYQGKEYDDLPQVKKSIGSGILIINTISSLE